MTRDRVTVVHVRWSGSDGGPGRYLPGANYEETVQALEKAGFEKTVAVTEVSVTLNDDVDQRYYLPDADLGVTIRELRRAGFELVVDDPC